MDEYNSSGQFTVTLEPWERGCVIDAVRSRLSKISIEEHEYLENYKKFVKNFSSMMGNVYNKKFGLFSSKHDTLIRMKGLAKEINDLEGKLFHLHSERKNLLSSFEKMKYPNTTIQFVSYEDAYNLFKERVINEVTNINIFARLDFGVLELMY